MNLVLSACRFAPATLLAAMALVAEAGTAAADPPGPAYWLYDRSPLAPQQVGQFYIGFNLQASRQHVPGWNSTTGVFGPPSTGPLTLPTAIDTDVIGVQPGGEIGYVFRDGTLPPWLGNRARVAVFGSIFSGERNAERSGTVPALSGYNILSLSGSSQNGSLTFGVNAPFNESFKFRRDSFEVGLKFESDMALGPDLSLTPGIAVFGGQVRDKYEWAWATINAVSSSTIDERLRTNEFGGHLGARLTWQFMPGWAVHAGGTAGVAWMRSRLTGSECSVIGSTTCGVAGSALSSVTDTDSTVSFRGTASLGIAADMRIAVISVGGFMRYDSRIPGIQNPQPATFTAASSGVPAHIRYESGFGYGGFLTLRVPLH